MKRRLTTDQADVIIVGCLVAVLLAAAAYFAFFATGCAVKRWERRINRVEDTIDSVEYIADKSEKVIDKTKSVSSPPVAR